MQETPVWFLGQEDLLEKERLPTPVFLGFPGGSAGKESACNARDTNSISGTGRSAGEGIGYTLQYSLASLVAQLVKNLPAMQETWVGSLDWEDPLEKEKATHSNILAWRIPWTVRSMGSQRIRHDWATFTSLHLELLCTQGKIHIKKCLCLTRVSKQTHSLQSKLSRPRYWICFLPRVSTVSHV